MSAFRYFLKTAKAELMLSYIWVAEKSTDSFLHFHLVGDCAHAEGVAKWWVSACRRFGITAQEHNVNLEFIEGDTQFAFFESAKKISLYMSKGTVEKIDGKLFSMSNDMQYFKPQNFKRIGTNAVLHLTDSARRIYENNYCAVYDTHYMYEVR